MNLFLYIRSDQRLGELWFDILTPWIDGNLESARGYFRRMDRHHTVRLNVESYRIVEVNGASLTHYIGYAHDFGPAHDTVFDGGYHFGSVLDLVDRNLSTARFERLFDQWNSYCIEPRQLDQYFVDETAPLWQVGIRTARTTRNQAQPAPRRPVLSRRKVEVLPLP